MPFPQLAVAGLALHKEVQIQQLIMCLRAYLCKWHGDCVEQVEQASLPPSCKKLSPVQRLCRSQKRSSSDKFVTAHLPKGCHHIHALPDLEGKGLAPPSTPPNPHLHFEKGFELRYRICHTQRIAVISRKIVYSGVYAMDSTLSSQIIQGQCSIFSSHTVM